MVTHNSKGAPGAAQNRASLVLRAGVAIALYAGALSALGAMGAPALAGAGSAAETLWVTSFNNNTVTSYTSSSGANATPLANLSSIEPSLSGPESPVFDASGDLWVANTSDNTVAEFTPGQLSSGVETAAVTISAGTTGSLDAPSAMAFDHSGDLWVANDLSNTVVEFTPGQLTSGSPVPATTIQGSALSSPSSLAFDASGDLWVANASPGTVVEYTPQQLAAGGSPVPAVTLSSDANGSLAYADALAFDGNGDLWVAAPVNDSLAEFTPQQLVSGSPAPAITIGPANNSLADPVALAFGASGQLWVANLNSNQVVAFTSAQLAGGGSPAPSVVLSSTASSSLVDPYGLAFDGHGDLWVADNSTNALVDFTAAELASSGAPAPVATVLGTTGLDGPEGTVFDPSGDLWVANSSDNTVSEYTPNELTTGSPVPKVNIEALGGPATLAFDAAGDLWVANYNTNTVVEFTPAQLAQSGAPAPAVTVSATPGGSLNGPQALAFDAAGDLWVVNIDNNSLVEYTPAQLGAGGPTAPATTITSSALGGPAGIAIAAPPATPGNVAVAPGNSEVSISWGKAAGASSYEVFDSASPGGEDYSGAPACVEADTATSCTVTGLSDGTEYYFTVEALGPGGPSAPTAEVSATPGAPAPPTSTTTTSAQATTTTAPAVVAPIAGVTTTTTTSTSSPLPVRPAFPGAAVTYPNGSIISFAGSDYVLAGGRAFGPMTKGVLQRLQICDHAKVLTAGAGAGAPVARQLRSGTLLTTQKVTGDPTIYVVGPDGELYGLASVHQLRDGGFDPALVVTVPSLGGLKVASTTAGAKGLTALSTRADGAIVHSGGTFYVFAGGKAFGIPTTAALATVRKADTAVPLIGKVTAAETLAIVADGVLLSSAGTRGVFVTYQEGAYKFKAMGQLFADGYGGTAAVPVAGPPLGNIAIVFPYSGS